MGRQHDGAMEGAGFTRRAVIAGAGGLAAAGAVAPEAAAAPVRRLAEPRHDTAAAEVVGEIAQAGAELTGYGYLTRLAGLADGRLFRAGQRDEHGARFTFAADVTVRERFIRGTLISVTGTGTLSLYLDGGGGDFATPATFSDGTLIATFSARFQNVLTVTAPNQAITAIEGELRQRSAHRFNLGGHRYQLGHRGLRLQLSVTGPGTRTDPATPRAVFEVAGRFAPAR
jgi:hypothetical protein